MRKNLKNVQIEFYGVPGSGKSTISHIVAEQLKENGFVIGEPTYFLDHDISKWKRKFGKIALLFCYMLIHPYRFAVLCRKLWNFTKRKPQNFLRQLVNICPKLFVYLHLKADYVLWDEGIVQSAVSMILFDNHRDINSVIRDLMPKDIEIFRIYIKTSVGTALKRMENRSTNDSRVEKESNYNAKINMMKEFEEICDNVDMSNIYICEYKNDMGICDLITKTIISKY